MRLGRTRSALASRLFAAMSLACVLLALACARSAVAESSLDQTSAADPLSVRIVDLGLPPSGPDGWSTLPVNALVVHGDQAEGEIWYRFGPGPGPWTRFEGPITVPLGKQTLSAMLVAPDGTSGPIAETIVRSDLSVLPVSGAGAPPRSVATYNGTATVAGSIRVQAVIRAQVGITVVRRGGNDRYATAAEVSSYNFASADTVIVATGQNFPDALTASGLAGCLNAPVLLVYPNGVPDSTAQEILRLGAKHAIICGGERAVGKSVPSKLAGLGMTVERIAGGNRYDTAVKIAQRVYTLTGDTQRVYIARGDLFPDALALSPLAYKRRAPILLTAPSQLSGETASQLSSAHYATARIGGSTGAVSPAAEAGVRAYVPDVDRWAGSTRYETAAACAQNGALEGTSNWAYLGIATGIDFPDALCGGAAMGRNGGLILLTAPNDLSGPTAAALSGHTASIAECQVYGKDRAVSPVVYNQIWALLH